MSRRPSAAAIFALLVVSSFLAIAPNTAAAQPGQYEKEFNNVLHYDHYNATAITITSPAIIGYASKSNVSIYTAFMNAQQRASFTEPAQIEDAVFVQQGTANYDALLEVPGTYYLVTYNPAQGETANVTELYIVDYDVNLSNSTTSVGLTITIQPGEMFSIPLHAETLGSSSEVQILGASSEVVDYTLLDRTTGTDVFRSPDVTITNFTVFPSVSLGYNISLSPGIYIMSIQNESPDPAYVYFEYDLVPAYVNPFLVNTGPPWPTGIAAFGIYNYSGRVVPYKVETNSIVGFAQVSQLKAVDAQSRGTDASLQQNNVLQVNNTDGSVFTYWPQNVLAFDTGASLVTFRDNVLNTTGENAQLTNQSITGTGITTTTNNDGLIQTYYGNYNSTYTYSYTLPQSFVMYMNESVEQGRGVLIQMGVRALNGPHPAAITWYDNITIVDPSVVTSAFVVDGKEYTPAGATTYIGSYYDSELVFGGGAGGEAATFQLNAQLALFYWQNGTIPFKSLYTFGDDTGESAYNIDVTNGSNVAVATSGTPYYGLLTNDYNGSLSALVSQAMAQGAGIHLTGVGYLVVAAILAAVVVVALVLVLRIRASRAQPVFVPAPEIGDYCGACGAPLEPGARFCSNCGKDQQAYVLPPPPPPGPPETGETGDV